MTHHELIRAIVHGGFDQEQLTMISDAVRHAYKMDRAQRLTDAQMSLGTGHVVMLAGIRPKALNGITGRIENFRTGATRADLRVTDANWGTRYNVGDLIRGVPLICFKPIPASVVKRANDLKRARALKRRVARGGAR